VLRKLRIHLRTGQSLNDLARWLNPIIAGWMNYYGRYYRSALYPLLRRYKRSKRWWAGIQQREPGLFVHWRWARGC
jgi:RNA-directed DNA polymerase